MRRILWLLALSGLLWLPGCGSDSKDVAEELNINRSGFNANFNPGAGVIPFPNNLLYAGPPETRDGTLNIPVANAADFSDPKVAMNALDGFSTIAPISTTFGGTIDPESITPASVRMFEVQLSTLGGTRPVGGPVTGVIKELSFGTDFSATISSVDPLKSTLIILPLKPLKPRSHYLVSLTSGIKNKVGLNAGADVVYVILKSKNPLIDSTGKNLVSSITSDPDLTVPGSRTADQKALALEPLRLLVNAQEAALASFRVDTSPVILSWTFSTQSIGNVLTEAKAAATGVADVNPTPIGNTANLLPGASPGMADVFLGSLTVPYYLANASSSPLAPLTSFWQGSQGSNLTFLNPKPAIKSYETIPLLVSIPNVTSDKVKPSTGWKVAIFQHGITSNRTSMLALADSMARAGFAVVAIDLPLHGLPPGHTLPSGYILRVPQVSERTFDLNLVNNNTGAPRPDERADGSGTHFINLSSLLTSRDNFRQGVADLFALTNALPTMDVDGGGPDFDPSQIYFIGHSLGGMIGSVFLAQEQTVKSAVLGMPGGGIAKLLDGSAAFGPQIAAGLATKGVLKGSADYESFLGAAQTVIDSADPLNYAPATSSGRGVLLFEVVGDGAGSLPDQVVPNNVLANAPAGTVPSPLAGTDPLATFMGLTRLTTTTAGLSQKAWMRFTTGDHASLLSPAASLAATTVMQEAMATFLASNGNLVAISVPGSGPVVARAGMP